MRAIFSSLMTVWMAILTMSGWCCHPLVGCAHDQNPSASASPKIGCCKHCQSREGRESTVPCKCRTGCQGICVYLPSQKIQLDSERVLASFDIAAIISSNEESQVQSALCWARGCDSASFEPPLRLHLLHRTLLI